VAPAGDLDGATLEELLEAAVAADTPGPALPRMPSVRRRALDQFPLTDQDRRAIEEVRQRFWPMLVSASDSAFLGGLRFLDRVC
jgi:hypothetical protein